MRIFKTLLMILFSCVLLQCSETAEKVTKTGPGGNVSGTGNPSVSIGPLNATPQSVIKLNADASLLRDSNIEWLVNSLPQKNSNSLRLDTETIGKGDIVQAIIKKGGTEYTSNKISIKNTPPVILKAGLVPRVPKAVSTLSVEAVTEDADNDSVSLKYRWYVNGKLIGDQSIIESEFKRNDTIEVDVVPYDGEHEGRKVRLTSPVYNSLPVFEESSPVFDGETYRCTIRSTDPDGDDLAYTLEEGPEGMSIDTSTGEIVWKVPDDTGNRHSFKVSIEDGHGGRIIVPFSAKIGLKEEKEE